MSIQQRIASDVYRMADKAVTPEQIKALQAHLVSSVQSGSVPSYVGVPLLNDLNQKMARIQTAPAQAQAMVQQPPIAQQVVGQAEQDQGVETLPSGLPEQGMAGGGIVAFAGGGMSDSEIAANLLSDEDDEDDDYVKQILSEFQRADYENAARRESTSGIDGARLASLGGLEALRGKESFSVKEEGQPAKTTSREVEAVRKPGGVEDLLKMIEQKESGGRRFDKAGNLLTSPKGAMGEMQVMPGTVRDPGFGVAPARDSSPDEIARVGRDYFKALLSKYNDPKVAAIAYNWGPGNTDKWLSSGADMRRLPAETQKYAQGFAEGGIASVKRFQYGGISATSPFDISALGLDDLKRMASMGERSAIEELAKRQGAAGISSIRAASPAVSEMNLSNPRVVGGAPSVAPTAAAATEGGLGGLWNAVKSGLGRLNPRGIGAWTLGTYSPELNVGEEEELKRRWDAYNKQQAAKPAEVQAAPVAPTTQAQPAAPTPPLGDIDIGFGANQYAPEEAAAAVKETKVEAGGEEAGIRSILDKYRENVGKQREIDAYLSLLSAGLGMMGGTSPYGMANIGRGAQQGVATYAQLGAQRGADERALLGAEVGLEKYKLLGDIRKQQFAAGQDSKQAALEQKQMQSSIDAIRRYEMQAENDSRLIAQERVKQASKDLVNPITDEQRNAIYADERAKALARLRMNPTYIRLMKIATPEYDPSQVALSESDNKILSKYLNTR